MRRSDELAVLTDDELRARILHGEPDQVRAARAELDRRRYATEMARRAAEPEQVRVAPDGELETLADEDLKKLVREGSPGARRVLDARLLEAERAQRRSQAAQEQLDVYRPRRPTPPVKDGRAAAAGED